MIVVVEVDVALRRPPRADRTLRFVLAIDPDVGDFSPRVAELTAELIACHMAQATPGVVMPVASRVVDILEL